MATTPKDWQREKVRWLKETLQPTLKRQAERFDSFTTASGIAIEPLYTPRQKSTSSNVTPPSLSPLPYACMQDLEAWARLTAEFNEANIDDLVVPIQLTGQGSGLSIDSLNQLQALLQAISRHLPSIQRVTIATETHIEVATALLLAASRKQASHLQLSLLWQRGESTSTVNHWSQAEACAESLFAQKITFETLCQHCSADSILAELAFQLTWFETHQELQRIFLPLSSDLFESVALLRLCREALTQDKSCEVTAFSPLAWQSDSDELRILFSWQALSAAWGGASQLLTPLSQNYKGVNLDLLRASQVLIHESTHQQEDVTAGAFFVEAMVDQMRTQLDEAQQQLHKSIATDSNSAAPRRLQDLVETALQGESVRSMMTQLKDHDEA